MVPRVRALDIPCPVGVCIEIAVPDRGHRDVSEIPAASESASLDDCSVSGERTGLVIVLLLISLLIGVGVTIMFLYIYSLEKVHRLVPAPVVGQHRVQRTNPEQNRQPAKHSHGDLQLHQTHRACVQHVPTDSSLHHEDW